MTNEEWKEVQEYYKRRGIRMTNEEAIKRLNKIKAIYQGMDNKSDVKALDMAIKALQEIDFLTLLMNNINKNDLEVYFSMYHAQNEEREEEE